MSMHPISFGKSDRAQGRTAIRQGGSFCGMIWPGSLIDQSPAINSIESFRRRDFTGNSLFQIDALISCSIVPAISVFGRFLIL